MKLVISRDNLVEAISIVQKAVSTRSTLPILDGILIEAAANNVKLTGYDLETGIEALVDADVMEEGSIVIPSKVFGEIVRKLPYEEVAISTNERMVIDIESGTSKFSINGISSEGFPKIPEVGEDNKIILNQEILRNMISQTIFAISTDEGRPMLNGSLFESDGKNINVVSIDGFRMAHRKKAIGEDLPVLKFLIPGKALHEAARILTGKDAEVVIYASTNHILFDTGKFRIVSRLINGEFLDYHAIVPKNSSTTMIVDKNAVLNAVERASLIIQKEDRRCPVNLSMDDEETLVIRSSTELGNLREEVKCEITGELINVDFNHKYIMDALRAIDDDTVKFLFSGANGPSVVVPTEGEEYTYLILPLRK